MRMTQAGALAAIVGVLSGAACSSQSSTQLTPLANAGSAGESGSGGEAGSGVAGDAGAAGHAGAAEDAGSAGAAGQGGSLDGAVNTGGVHFQAAVGGDTVSLTAPESVWLRACDRDNPQLIEQINGAWVPLRDERPYDTHLQFDSYYLDGVYESGCYNSLGCDVDYCYRLGQTDDAYASLPLLAREYVQIGERAALACGASDAGAEIDNGSGLDAGVDGSVGAGVQRVPNLESRAPSGRLRVRLTYFANDRCTGEMTTAEIDVVPPLD